MAEAILRQEVQFPAREAETVRPTVATKDQLREEVAVYLEEVLIQEVVTTLEADLRQEAMVHEAVAADRQEAIHVLAAEADLAVVIQDLVEAAVEAVTQAEAEAEVAVVILAVADQVGLDRPVAQDLLAEADPEEATDKSNRSNNSKKSGHHETFKEAYLDKHGTTLPSCKCLRSRRR